MAWYNVYKTPKYIKHILSITVNESELEIDSKKSTHVMAQTSYAKIEVIKVNESEINTCNLFVQKLK